MSLFSKVSGLLACSLLVSALGSLLGAGITSGAVQIGLGVAFFLGLFVVFFAAQINEMLGLLTLFVWTFVSGLFMGPVLGHYANVLGAHTIVFAFLGTAGVMAVCAMIGAFSGRDFSGMGRILQLALFGLIIVGIVNIFVGFGHVTNLVYAALGMIVFAGYFIFDFFRLSQAENNNANAIMLTVLLYLDFGNFLLELCQFLVAAASESDD